MDDGGVRDGLMDVHEYLSKLQFKKLDSKGVLGTVLR